MMKKFKDIPAALAAFEVAAEKHAVATETGDHKTANKNYDIIISVVNVLKSENKIDYLYQFLSHNSIGVRSAAASYLLESYEKQAVEVLEQIKGSEYGIHSFNAEMVLSEWRKGNLKF
jgi:hypothetical protein